MKSANHKLPCAWMLVLGLLLGACRDRSGSATNASNNAANNAPARTSANRSAAAREDCAAMTNEVSAITGLKLRQPPLELHAPDEGLLRGCTWSEEGGGLNTFGITKEPASRYDKHDEDKYRKAFPERFKAVGVAHLHPSANTMRRRPECSPPRAQQQNATVAAALPCAASPP